MNDKDIIIEIQKARKKQERKEKIQRRFNTVKRFCNENKELLMFVGPIAVGVIAKTVKFASKNVNLRKEEKLKKLYCYDRSLGHYWKLRRELSNSEWVKIDKRKNNGERLADILNELKVLK